MKAYLVSAAAAVALAPGVARAEPCNDWTVAIVLEADGGLQRPLANDLIELTNAAWNASPCINLVVQFERNGRWERRYRNWANSPVPDIRPNTEIDDDKLRDYWPNAGGERRARLSDAGALSGFITEVARDFPAQQMALIIGSHGDAVRAAGEPGGVAEDGARSLGSAQRPLLNRNLGDELRAGMGTLPDGTSLVLVGFDACQMAALEAQYELALVARDHGGGLRVVASQENQDGPGWHYTDLLGRLTGAVTAPDLAQRFLTHGPEAWKQWSVHRADLGTLSHLELADLVSTGAAFDELGVELLANARLAGYQADVLEAVRDARCSCRRFPDVAGLTGGSLVDAQCFAQRAAVEPRLDRSVRTRASEASLAVDAAVVDMACGRDAASDDRCGKGLSIFLPPRDAPLSGYSETVTDPPRFVRRDSQDVGGWAQWVRFWAARAPSCR